MQVGDPVLHIELTRWADCLVLAPMSANCLAKSVNGLCDDLLACVLRAWPPEKPLLLVPAMHQLMWQHPFSRTHIDMMTSNARCGLLLGDNFTFNASVSESQWQNIPEYHVEGISGTVQRFMDAYLARTVQ
jgi:hypothetical protein